MKFDLKYLLIITIFASQPAAKWKIIGKGFQNIRLDYYIISIEKITHKGGKVVCANGNVLNKMHTHEFNYSEILILKL